MTIMWALKWDGDDEDDFFHVRNTRRETHDFLMEFHDFEREPDVSRRNIIRRERRRGLRAVKVRIVRA